jgi:hypothetical protein
VLACPEDGRVVVRGDELVERVKAQGLDIRIVRLGEHRARRIRGAGVEIAARAACDADQVALAVKHNGAVGEIAVGVPAGREKS